MSEFLSGMSLTNKSTDKQFTANLEKALNVEFLPLSPAIADEWDQVIYNSCDGWAFSLSSWLDMVTRVWKDRWKLENHSFAVRENGKIMAVMPLHFLSEAFLLSSSGWGVGGPVVISDASGKNRWRLWYLCLSHAQEIGISLGARHFSISISPLTRASLENRWGVNPLVKYGFEDVSSHTKIIDLSQSEDDLWFQLSKDTRQKIKKVRTAGYRVQKVCWKDWVDKYYYIHVETYERTHVQPHPEAYFEGIAGLEEETHALFAGFSPQGNAVAFHNDARFDSTSMYHTGCGETEHLASGINYLLVWESILDAKNSGMRWYEVGEVFFGEQEEKNMGLTTFKSKFGGEIHRIFRGKLALSTEDDFDSGSSLEPVIGRRALIKQWIKLLGSAFNRITTCAEILLEKFSKYGKKHDCNILKEKVCL